MFMFDVGLLTAKAGLSARLLLDGSRIFEEFKGALTEQYVAQELHAAGYPLYYFATERSTGEIDFMLQGDLDCIPIEVKAEQNLRAKSLKLFVINISRTWRFEAAWQIIKKKTGLLMFHYICSLSI